MGKRLVVITYFKETGKYYTNAGYLTEKENDWEIYEEVRHKRYYNELPGLDSEEFFSGYCIIDPEMGIRQLLDFTPASNE